MFKMAFGNLLFFGILFGWYLYVDGDRSLMLSGVILGFGCFLSGIFMGYILHSPPKRRAASTESEFAPNLSEAVEETFSKAVVAESTADEANHEDHEHSDSTHEESESAVSEVLEPTFPDTRDEPEQHAPDAPVAVVEAAGELGVVERG